MGYGENTSRIEALKNARLDIQEQIASAIETEVKSKLSVYSLEYKQHYENRIEITLQSKVDQSFFLNTPIYTESYWETINKKFRKNEINYYKYYLLAKISRGFIDTLRNIDQLEDNYRGAIIDSLLGPLNRLDLINNLDPMPLLNNCIQAVEVANNYNNDHSKIIRRIFDEMYLFVRYLDLDASLIEMEGNPKFQNFQVRAKWKDKTVTGANVHVSFAKGIGDFRQTIPTNHNGVFSSDIVMKSVLRNNRIKIEFDFDWIFAHLRSFDDDLVYLLSGKLREIIEAKSVSIEFSTLGMISNVSSVGLDYQVFKWHNTTTWPFRDERSDSCIVSFLIHESNGVGVNFTKMKIKLKGWLLGKQTAIESEHLISPGLYVKPFGNTELRKSLPEVSRILNRMKKLNKELNEIQMTIEFFGKDEKNNEININVVGEKIPWESLFNE